MNRLILNRETFDMPEDGWYQIAPLGEFPHSPSGVVQVVDAAACASMVSRFAEDSRVENFAGLLIDFDHFSLDEKNRSEAAGWITDLENRDSGLWAKVRWSDLGEDAVKGGRYRFISPVWARGDCEDLGNARVRPVRLLNAAVTNDPNLKGMVPLSNRRDEGGRLKAEVGEERENGPSMSAGEIVSTEKAALRNRPTPRSALRRARMVDFSPVVDGGALDGPAGRNGMERAMSKTDRTPEKGGATSPAPEKDVEALANSLRLEREKNDVLLKEVVALEDELVNRCLADFESVVTDDTRDFWREQLLSNREAARGVLAELARAKESNGEADAGRTRRPLHNRQTARPVPGGQAGSGGEAETKALKIRNRAHELVKTARIPFATAFRRAEREIVGEG